MKTALVSSLLVLGLQACMIQPALASDAHTRQIEQLIDRFQAAIARSKSPRSETISNVRIDTDGEITQVWFDFAFMSGDYKSAWGKESWQLVRTDAGWTIAAVVWSAEENPTPP